MRRILTSRPSPRRGWALVTAIIAVVAVSVLTAGLARMMVASARETEQREGVVQADQLAESARWRAEAQLRQQPDYTGETWSPENPAGPALRALITIQRAESRTQIHVVCLVPADDPRPARVEQTWTVLPPTSPAGVENP